MSCVQQIGSQEKSDDFLVGYYPPPSTSDQQDCYILDVFGGGSQLYNLHFPVLLGRVTLKEPEFAGTIVAGARTSVKIAKHPEQPPKLHIHIICILHS